MKILNICCDDWANFAYDNMMAMRTTLVVCDGYKLNAHVSRYANELPVVALDTIREEIKKYDIIQYFHDNAKMFKEIMDVLKGKRVVVYHTSSIYRANHIYLNQLMNEYIDTTINAMPEFMGKGSRNEHYVVGAVDTSDFFRYKAQAPYIIGHYPSNSTVKGTSNVVDLMVSLQKYGLKKYIFDYTTDTVPHHKQLERMAACDIYIEMFTEQDSYGSPYGDFGITALEAAAMGLIVVTNNRHRDVYESVYGASALRIANTRTEFLMHMLDLLTHPVSFIEYGKKISREWVEKNHSYIATGKRISDIIFKR